MARIALDVDEVACKTLERCLDTLNARLSTDYEPDVFHEWDIFQCIPKQAADMLNGIFLERDIWDEMLPPNDAQAIVKRMVRDGHDVFFVSNCHTKTHDWKSDWLCRVYPFVPRDNHIYTAHKKLLLVDYLIDDNIDWLRESTATRILMDKPWNWDARTGFDFRVKSLTEAWDKICELEKERDRD